MVDYSQFRKSQNIEGAPSTPAQSMINDFLVPFTGPMQESLENIMAQYAPLLPYKPPAEPEFDPNAPNPLGEQAGLADVGVPPIVPHPSPPVSVDPDTIQALLDQISPPESINDLIARRYGESDLPVTPKPRSAFPPPSGDLTNY